MSKRCPACKTVKSDEEFSKQASRPDGLNWRCRPCQKTYSAERYASQTPEQRKAYNEGNKTRSLEARKRLIFDLGGKCECCGQTEYYFLTIDHRDGSGGEHRKQYGNKTLSVSKLREHMEALRILCADCHLAITGWGRCPHEEER